MPNHQFFTLPAKADQNSSSEPPDHHSDHKPKVVNLVGFEHLAGAEREILEEEISKRSAVARFEGTVLHGYGSKHVTDVDRCPRCGAATEQRYANIVYNTQVSLRVMLAPVGHFCTQCPTMVVEEDLIIAGISERKYKYRFVVGVDFGEQRPPEYLQTWNGERLVYFLDEDGALEGVSTTSEFERAGRRAPLAKSAASLASAKKRAADKRREKQAKQSRKKNRKK